MKIEPRKIKKTLKYAAVGTCVAASLISTGCDKPEVVGDVPATDAQKNFSQNTEGELILDGDIAYPESTPEIIGEIPALDIDDEDETEIEFAGESAFYFEEE